MEIVFVFDSKKAITSNGGTYLDFPLDYAPSLPIDISKYYEVAQICGILGAKSPVKAYF